MGHGRGRTEHAGPRDMTRKHGHWGTTEEAKEWASRARRRAETAELRQALADGPVDDVLPARSRDGTPVGPSAAEGG